MNLPSKIWDGKVVAGPNECHIFTGAICDGYGYIWKNGRQRRAHRVIYEECWGPIPEGLLVLHKCNVRRCVNPLHLYVGTHVDNMRDRKETGYSHSEEWRLRSSKAQLGKVLSQEHRSNLRKASLAKTGAVLTPEARAKRDRHNELQRRRRRNEARS